MLSILTTVLDAVMNGLLAFFLPSKEEKLGRAEANSAILTKELNNVQKAQAAAATVKPDAGGVRDPHNRDE